jgi:hypothetical protein
LRAFQQYQDCTYYAHFDSIEFSNGKNIQNSITLVLGLVYALQNPPWCTFIESFPTTQKSVVGDDCHGLGDLHVTNKKQTNKQPSSIDGYKL